MAAGDFNEPPEASTSGEGRRSSCWPVASGGTAALARVDFLAVLDPARGAGVLPGHPRRSRLPFFKNPVSSTTSTASGSPRCSTT